MTPAEESTQCPTARSEPVAAPVGSDTAVLFDMDGVILRGRQTAQWVYDRATDRTLDALALSATDDQRARLQTFDVDDVEQICAALGADPEAFWRLREEHATAIANARIERGERTVHDDVDAIERIGQGHTLGLVSNNRHATVRFVAEHFDLPFAAVRGRDPTPAGFRRLKPDPHYLEETFATMDREAGLYVGDRRSDVEAAGRAGLDAAYLRRAHNEDDPLPAGASYELDSLSELATILE